jgi:chromosome segregation ATPase
MESITRKFDIQYFAEGEPGGNPPEPVELEEEISAEAYGKLDETFKRIYKQVAGKDVYSLNRKGKDTLAETIAKEREERKKAEKALSDLGMPVEEAKKLIEEHVKQKKASQSEAEKLQDAIAKAYSENEATKKALEAMQSDLAASKLEAVRLKVQSELKIPDALMKFLIGGAYEELKTAGTELMAHVKPEDPSQIRIGDNLPPDSSKNLDAKDIEQQIKRGLEKAKKINEATVAQKEERRAY